MVMMLQQVVAHDQYWRDSSPFPAYDERRILASAIPEPRFQYFSYQIPALISDIFVVQSAEFNVKHALRSRRWQERQR